MKVRGCPFPLLFLLLLMGGAARDFPWSAPWDAWWLPILALLPLAGCLFSGGLPARIWVAGGVVLGLVALYAWNPSHCWADGRGLVPLEHIRSLPAAAYPEGAWETFRLALALFAAFALASQLSCRQIHWLQGIAAVASAGMALAVLLQRLAPNPFHIYERTGIFVNENHFAVFSNLVLPVVLVMASRARFRAVQEGRASSPAGLLVLVAVLTGAAVVMCRSRAGVAVMALLVAAHGWLCRRTIRQYPFIGVPAASWTKAIGWLAIVVAAGFAGHAFWREWRQIGIIGQEWAFRSGILRDALAAWRENPVWGIGPGAFPTVFPYYQSAMFAGKTILHAHCEPVQFLVEFGAAGALLVLAAALWALGGRRPCPAGGTREIPPFSDLERQGFALGLLACGLHCCLDFPLRIPLIALLAAVWAGVWAGTRPPLDAQVAGSAGAEE